MNVRKLIEKMRRQPNSVSCEDLIAVARSLGMTIEEGAKHRKFKIDKKMLTVPRHDPVRSLYVKAFLRFAADLLPRGRKDG